MPQNHTTLRGAEKLAAHIKRYWGMQGYDVSAWVNPVKDNGLNHNLGKYVYEVKTDLINGLPRNWKGDKNGR